MSKSIAGHSSFWVHAAAVFAVAAWGISFINTRVLMDHDFTPVDVYIARCLIAYLLLFAFSCKRLRSRSIHHELLFLLCGICGGSIYFIAENTALVYTTATNVSLITSTSPLINALLVGLLYRDERPGRGLVLGSIIAMVGVSMVVIGGAPAHGAEETASSMGGLGDALSLMAAVLWSVYALLLRKVTPFYSAIYVTRKTFFYGMITALPFMLLEPSSLTPGVFASKVVWANLIMLAVVSSSLAFLIWTWVVNKLGAVKAGNYLYFQPVVTMIFGAIVLHEAITLWGVTGCVVTIFGVMLGERLSMRQRLLHH